MMYSSQLDSLKSQRYCRRPQYPGTVLVDGALLRGENLDEALTVEGSDVAVVRLGQVSLKTELNGEAVHLVDVGVDAVGHRDVDEAVVRARGTAGLARVLVGGKAVPHRRG